MAAMTSGAWVLTRRLVRNQLKMPSFILLSISQPLMYLVFFGMTFSHISGLGNGANGYIMWLTPGMIIWTAFFGSAYTALAALADVEGGFVDRLIVSPLPRFSIAFSYVLSNLLVVVLQVVIMAAVGCLIAGFPSGGFGGLLFAGLVACMVAVAFGAISNTIGYWLNRTGPVLSVMNFLTLPLMFLSGMLISPRSMPDWIVPLSNYNPLRWAVVAAQDAYLGDWQLTTWRSVGQIVAFTIFCLMLMNLSFARFVKTR